MVQRLREQLYSDLGHLTRSLRVSPSPPVPNQCEQAAHGKAGGDAEGIGSRLLCGRRHAQLFLEAGVNGTLDESSNHAAAAYRRQNRIVFVPERE